MTPQANQPSADVLVPREFLDFLRNAPVFSGACCCGDNMDGHADPMSCGHSPVDMWDHALDGWLKQIADRQAREEARDGGGWRTIDSAPRDWVDVLLFVPKLCCDHRKVCEGWHDENKGEWRSAAFGRVRPTHWRPLPVPPAIEPSPVEGDRR